MPLREPPPAAGALSDLPAWPLTRQTLHRVWRHRLADGTDRPDPWYFSAAEPKGPQRGGRFDLPAPLGTCYLATSALAATLEALQDHLAILPIAELRARRRAQLTAPDVAPDAADVTARAAAGTGITAALWAGTDRPLTQRWAAALRRDGWWAIHAGAHHDPAGRLRTVALFDQAGARTPTHRGDWTPSVHTLHDDQALLDELADCGLAVHGEADLPRAHPEP